jgi:hypothetical protein
MAGQEEGNGYDKLTTSKLAKALGLRTGDLTDRLITAGYLVKEGDCFKLTDLGKDVDGEFRFSKELAPYFLRPAEMSISVSRTPSCVCVLSVRGLSRVSPATSPKVRLFNERGETPEAKL